MSMPADLEFRVAESTPRKLTYEEFLKQYDGMHAEWVDGEAIVMTPISSRHMKLSYWLGAILTHFVEAHDFGLIGGAPFQMKGPGMMPGREPDLIFISKASLARMKNNFLDGPADLAIEIVSPDNPARDWEIKFAEYQKIGVPEYWIIDPLQDKAAFYHLNEAGVYASMPIGADGIFRSAELSGLWVKLDWLWQEPLPKVMDVIREWGLV